MPTLHEHSRQFAVDVVRQLREAGFQSVWAGGCVRDHLLGRVPKDFDVATDAQPQQVRDLFGLRHTIPVGLAFGVITVLGPKEAAPIEVATFRQDVGYTDGRHPDSVRFCDPREDAQRRDFTINGLFYDPLEDQVLDYVGGKEDLAQGIIRAIGDAELRFEEDRLRMLRAVRFATNFGFEIESNTFQAIQQNATGLSRVSQERISNELRRMLSHPRRAYALQLLTHTGLSAALPPLVSDRFSQEPERLQRALGWLEKLSHADFASALSIIVLSAFGSGTESIELQGETSLVSSIAECMKLSNPEKETLLAVARSLRLIVQLDHQSWPQTQPYLVGPYGTACLEVAQAWSRSTDRRCSEIELVTERTGWPLEKLDPKPLLNGADLKGLGLSPGPQFSHWLGEVRREQLLGNLSNREQAIRWVQERLSQSTTS